MCTHMIRQLRVCCKEGEMGWQCMWECQVWEEHSHSRHMILIGPRKPDIVNVATSGAVNYKTLCSDILSGGRQSSK